MLTHVVDVFKYKKFRHGVLYNTDIRKFLKNAEDASFDLILTDPPYGLNKSTFDDGDIVFQIEHDLYRVLKDDSFFVFYYSVKKLNNIAKFKYFKYLWQIIALFPSSFSKSSIGDRCYAPVLIFGKGKPKVQYRRQDVIPTAEIFSVKGAINNQLFKPTFTTSVLLQMFHRGGVVLDPFAGFGSICFVCEQLGIEWVGVEIDPVKFMKAVKFIESGDVGAVKDDSEGGQKERKKEEKLSRWLR